MRECTQNTNYSTKALSFSHANATDLIIKLNSSASTGPQNAFQWLNKMFECRDSSLGKSRQATLGPIIGQIHCLSTLGLQVQSIDAAFYCNIVYLQFIALLGLQSWVHLSYIDGHLQRIVITNKNPAYSLKRKGPFCLYKIKISQYAIQWIIMQNLDLLNDATSVCIKGKYETCAQKQQAAPMQLVAHIISVTNNIWKPDRTDIPFTIPPWKEYQTKWKT